MLLTVAVVFWLASSYIEYKIVKASPRLIVLFRGVPGIIISLAIGAALAFAVGASNAMPIVLAQMVGLATNEIMFDFFSRMENLNDRRKEATDKITGIRTRHPGLFSEAVTGIKAGFQVLVGIVLAILWVLGLPVRIIRWVNNAYTSITNIFSKGATAS